MRTLQRFIPGEEIGAVDRWDFGAVDFDGLRLQAEAAAEAQAAEEARLEQVRQEAYAQGFAAGREHGHTEAMLEAQRQIEAFMMQQGQETARQLAGLLSDAKAQFDQAEEVSAQGVLELACALAREVLRHEMSSNPNALLPVIREGLASLFADSRQILIRLNPVDMDMLQDTLRSEFPNLALAFQPEPTLARGGCTIESAGTVIDATAAKRWSRAVGRLGMALPWDVEADDES
jgi:flagellar assembly protein FliH